MMTVHTSSMRLLRRGLRHLLSLLICGLLGHVALLGAIMGAGLGGPYAAFAVTQIQNSVMVTTGLRVAADGPLQTAWMLFGPFLAPVAAALVVVVLVAWVFRMRSVAWHVLAPALLASLPLALRLGAANPGAPTVITADVALAAAAGACAGLVNWLLAARVIGKPLRRQAASG